jgi:hypothetical protein
VFTRDNPALNACLTQLAYGAVHPLREVLGRQLSESTRSHFSAISSGDVDDPDGMVGRLRGEGLVELGRVLDDRQIADVHAALRMAPVFPAHVAKLDGRPQPYPFEALRGRVHYASYAVPSLLAAPHLIELANDPRLLKVVEGYLGCPPTLYSVNAWWSFPQQDRAPTSQALHRDRDDFRFVTMFVYLTPVTPLSGPHQYVRCSHDAHVLARLLVQGGLPEAQLPHVIEALFAGTGYQNSETAEALLGGLIHTWIAPAGSAILADTYGLHMGKPPHEGERLMFWARYGLGANDGMVADADVGGGVDLSARIGRDPRTRYVNRLLTGDRDILRELGGAP